MTIIGAFAGASMGNGSPKHMITGSLIGAITLGPIIYWLKI
jgi:hypothetical protein